MFLFIFRSYKLCFFNENFDLVIGNSQVVFSRHLALGYQQSILVIDKKVELFHNIINSRYETKHIIKIFKSFKF